MTKLFNTIFDKGIYPSEWAKAIIIPIHKKGNIHSVDNYRGVSLLSIISKCYTSVLNTRLYTWLEENERIVETQAGFRRNYSTTDQIFNLYAIAQKCLNKKGQKLYVAFVDFRKAFDSVRHDKLLQAVQQEGVKGKFFASIKSMYDSLLSCVRANNDYSDFFECPVG
ncbi:reverse transcriptase family protein, partial [Thiolapillus sp.]